MKEAIVFPTEEEEELLWTVARAMNSGWMFKRLCRKGNGYIFDSNDIRRSPREAESYLDTECC